MSGKTSYTIVTKLGEGGMAEVFKAVKIGPKGFQKPIALKRILPFYADHPSFVSMLAEEARLHAHLDHPNIVQLLGFQEDDQNCYIELEYVPGKNLRTATKDAKTKNIEVPWPLAIHTITEILEGLDFAHKRNGPDGPLRIVHRDISPQNILISYEGIIKLSDFGVAKARLKQDSTSPNAIKGKERYAAPEQLAHGETDHRADLFSIGVVLYELLCNQSPLKPNAPISRKLRPDLPTSIHKALEKALQADPRERHHDAASFRRELLAAQDSAWATRGAEKIRQWMERIYPKGKDRDEEKLEKTLVLSSSGNQRTAWLLLLLLSSGLMATSFWLNRNEVSERASPPVVTATLGIIRVVGPIDTEAFLNGQRIGKLPIEDLSLAPGNYVVLLKNPRGVSVMNRVTLSVGEIETIQWSKK